MRMYRVWIISAVLTCVCRASAGTQSEVATFSKDCAIYTLASNPAINKVDQIDLKFKTKQDESYIFQIGTHTSNSETGLQYIVVYLDNRQLVVQIKHDQIVDAIFKVSCVSIYSSCADNNWHSLSISRETDAIKIVVDKIVRREQSDGNVFSSLLTQNIVFGSSLFMVTGDDKTAINVPKYLKSYRGCFEKIMLTSENLDLDVLYQTKSKRNFQKKGEIYFEKCSDLFIIEPISFNTEAAYITLRGWAWAQKGKLYFTFKTTEPDSLLAYQKSESFQYNQFDFYAFEIRNSYLHFSINTGSGVYSQRVSSVVVSDGVNHYVKLWFERGKVQVQLDAEKKLEKSDYSYRILDITGDLYLGGISEDLVSFFPHSIWSGILRQGFVGCLIDISINDVPYDLALKAQNENISGISVGCPDKTSDKSFCENKPCMDGVCSLGYNRFICDCSMTNYTGNTCAKVAPLVKFNGFQYMIISMPHGFQSECEDVTLRFLTTRPNGVLIITRSRVSGAPDKIKIYIENGQLMVLVNFGKGSKVIKTDINVFDGRWHTFRLKRRQLNLILVVDDFEIKNNLSGTSKLLSNDIINLGRYVNGKEDMFFTGFMMHFTYNGVNYFEKTKFESSPNIEVTATIDNAEVTKEFPITFQSSRSYLRLPKVNMYGDFKLEFFIKTKTNNGKILQLYGKSGDYLVLEIVSGYLNLIFNWVTGYNKKINKDVRVDDNKWHRILLVREKSNNNAFVFRIDGEPKGSEANIPLQAGEINLNLYEDIFLGNADRYVMNSERHQSRVTTKDGFNGCIASFYMNHSKVISKPSIYKHLLRMSSTSKGVIEGCHEDYQYQVTCQPNSCHSNGRCIQQWIQIRCDCSMTSFSGDKCDRVSRTLRFRDYPAYLVFKFSPSRNTTMDELAFGIQTSSVTSTPVILVEGEGRQPDFISVKLLKDKGRAIIVVEYNMGSGISRLIEPAVNVADGFYHRIAFRRNGKVASLQIDDVRPRLLVPTAKTSIHFNQQRSIYVGKNHFSSQRSKRSIKNEFSQYFSGFLSGLYYNGIPLGDMIDNISHPGIKLLNRSNVYVETKFIPNFIKNPQIPSILSEQAFERDNDQVQKNNPLIIGKRNCSVYDTLHRLDCKPVDSRGLIKQNITYQINVMTIATAKIATTSRVTATAEPLSKIITDFKVNEPQKPGSINIWLIIGFSIGGSVLLILLTCFIYRCCRQDEGSYNVEEDRVFFDPIIKPLKLTDTDKNGFELNNNSNNNNSLLTNSSLSSAKHKPVRRDKNSETKEWYV